MRKLIASCAIALLAAGGIFAAATTASADDAAPDTAPVVVATPTPDATAAAPDTTAPEVDTTAPDPVTAPAVPDTKPADPVTPPAQPAPAAKVATQSRPTPVQVSWVLPEGQAPTGDYATPGKGSIGESGFPQVKVGTDGAATCGRWVQTDTYPSQKIADGFGDTLEYKEDWGQSSDWTFTKQADCAPPIVQCTNTGVSYSEDAAPVLTADGYLYTGQGQAVDRYTTVTGNLAGLGDASLTFKDVAGYQPSYTVVFNRTGSTGYANLVAEWYMNGGVPSTDGTFHITSSTLFWTNKIASGAGSQGDPQPLSFFSALWPTNTLISVGPHLGSAMTSDTHSVVTAQGGCVSESYAPTKPADLTGTDTGSAEPVCVVNDNGDNDGDATTTSWTQSWTQAYVWSDESHSYVLGDKVYGEKVYTTSEPAASADCPPPVATGIDHSSQQFCTQPKDGTLTTEAFEQSWTQTPVFAEGEWTLGDKVYGDTVLTSSTTAKDAACAVTIVKPNPPKSHTPAQRAAAEGLAETGGVPAWSFVGGAAAIILIGVAASAFGAYRRRQGA
jgi:hypothetical protein